MNKLVLVILALVIMMSCNNKDKFISKYNSFKECRDENIDSMIFYQNKIESIYGYGIIRFDFSINEDKWNKVYESSKDPYLMNYKYKLEMFNFCDSMLLVVKENLPIRMQDSIEISLLEDDIQFLSRLKSDSIVNARQIEIKEKEIQALKNKKYK